MEKRGAVDFNIRMKIDDAGKLLLEFDQPAEPTPRETRQQWAARQGLPPTILFTGFKSADRGRLEALAIQKKMAVCKSVTGGLNFLVGGHNAGPAKVEMARAEGAVILTEQEFLTLISTGEVPGERK